MLDHELTPGLNLILCLLHQAGTRAQPCWRPSA
jgi:hypothetical protein